MASPYELFKTDERAETEGITLDYGSFSFRIVRAGGSNRKFSDLLDRKLRPYRRQIENGTLDNKVAEKLMAECYADAVIIGWDGVTDAEGKPLAYTRENCVRLLTDLPDLFRDIQDQAGRFANFRAEELAADIKNSVRSSAGSTPTAMS